MNSLNPTNELMLSHVWRYLPNPLHNAYVCSSGTKGYCALKETLQNGAPGHTLLIESSDLRDVQSSEGQCCHVHGRNIEEHNRIPPTVTHVTAYGNMTSTPMYFLWGCAALRSVNLVPLSHVTEVREGFLCGCTGLTSVDLSPLSQVTEIHGDFLWGCTGLTLVDLGPLSHITEVLEGFLCGCTGLTSVDLRPLSRVAEVREGFLAGCTQITIVDIPPLGADPPVGWLLKEGKWVR